MYPIPERGEAHMSINIDANTVANAAILVRKENPDRHDLNVKPNQDLEGMLDGSWKGKLAGKLTAEYYNLLIHRYFYGSRSNFNTCAGHLKTSAENYELTEEINRELGEAFT